ncbi:hypothetical protein B7494_g478 [Chlorociboria aeruginascens]|nr:hypothetical protein B7494_g478 [Chlorociboria aeruginascens]
MFRHGKPNEPNANPADDICPVCKSNRYLNPSLEFLINPECYHKMCSTCVDRIFTSGPASCPVIHCGKTLRKKGFHKAFFADLKVEREVDIRKRVGAVFNRRQDEFESLLDWNNYLEEVEGLVFELVEGTSQEKNRAEEKLKMYMEGNALEIEGNRKAGLEEADLERRREKAEKEAAKQRRLAAWREEEEEKADVERERRDVLERLATTDGDAKDITQQAKKIILKKTSARRNLNDALLEANGAQDAALTIRGLKAKKIPVVEKAYDPFGGLDLQPTRYVLRGDYDNEWLNGAKSDPRHMAGGFSMQEYYARTMFEAFSGLGVFIEDEVERREKAIGTAAAAKAAGGELKVEMDVDDDVF